MNVQRIKSITQSQGYPILGIRHGMQLEIHEEVGEGDNKRTWRFKGLVIKVKRPNQADGTFTIRGKTSGITIEKIYPLSFAKFQKVLLLDEYKTARAKLYYIRDKVGKDAQMKSILKQEDRGIDLLEVAMKVAEKHAAAAKPATKAKEEKVEVVNEEVKAEEAQEEAQG